VRYFGSRNAKVKQIVDVVLRLVLWLCRSSWDWCGRLGWCSRRSILTVVNATNRLTVINIAQIGQASVRFRGPEKKTKTNNMRRLTHPDSGVAGIVILLDGFLGDFAPRCDGSGESSKGLAAMSAWRAQPAKSPRCWLLCMECCELCQLLSCTSPKVFEG
jgi:hypothetical protein